MASRDSERLAQPAQSAESAGASPPGAGAIATEDAYARAPYGQTPWQTVGPFFHFGLPWNGCADLTGPSAIGARPDLMPAGREALRGPDRRHSEQPPAGERIEISGRVFDAQGLPVSDALLEIWQANAAGHYRGSSAIQPAGPAEIDAAFFGFGRAATAADGSFCFRTLRPGRVPIAADRQKLQAPHIALGVQGRGLLKRLVTRIYFADEPSNAQDDILARVPVHRRATLIAERIEAPPIDTPSAGAAAHYRFDVRLQGERETVFFEW